MDTVSNRKERIKRFLIIVPVFFAIVVVAILMHFKKGPEKKPPQETIHQARMIRTQPVNVVPRAVGYGYVEAGQVWQVVPEVSGKIIDVSKAFKKGNFAHTGDILLKIDPTDYRLTVQQMKANLKNIEAQLAELNRKEDNYRISLEIEQDLLRLKQKEMERNEKALKSRSISLSAFDQARMNYHSQRIKVQDMENTLNLIPTSRMALTAQRDLNVAQLEEARLDLRRTEITVPFNCRITGTSAEIGQYVQRGQTIAEADGTAWAEITAQVPMVKMVNLFVGLNREPIRVGMETMDRIKMDHLKKIFDLKVRVHLVNAGFDAVWNARFARADATIDAQTRTLGIIVVVDKPYNGIILGKRPPLVRNMFCEVEISGEPIPDQIVIPRSAIHDGHVYIVDSDQRLQRRAVRTTFSQEDFAVIREGLEAGETVVVSDLIPAIDGMRLDVSEDTELTDHILRQATRPPQTIGQLSKPRQDVTSRN
jgi:RND family efflux transporter MFP subunit